MNIIVIAGAPGTGKTTFSRKLEGSMRVIYTDDLKDIPWESQSGILATAIVHKPLEKVVAIEGLCALRGVRKAVEYGWIDTDDSVTVFMFTEPYDLGRYSESLAKAQLTILADLIKKFPNTTVYYVKKDNNNG